MEVLAFAVVAILLYFFSDWLLRQIEGTLGRTLEERSLIFFVILLLLATGAFALIRHLFAG